MKFLHTADLHIGKKIFEQSLLEDQRFLLDQITEIALEEKVDAVVIAGDIYDRTVPSAEAVTLLDGFLTGLVEKGIKVIAVSGNHDSPERVSFADRILEKQGLHIAGDYVEPLKTVVLEDEYGPVYFVLLPFVKPAAAGAESSAEAVEGILGRMPTTLDLRSRHVLVTHFFVVGERGEVPECSDSETDSRVGGLDGVPASLFAGFDYVALGHIHKPQHMGKGNVYYSGSPLKYSFSEAGDCKAVNIVELGAANSGTMMECDADGQMRLRTERVQGCEVTLRRVPLTPLHDMRCIRGRLGELMKQEILEANREGRGAGSGLEDYLQVTLTDTEELIDPIGTLRSVYPNVLQILLEKNQSSEDVVYESRIVGERKGVAELFGDFYQLLKGESMDEKRWEIVEEAAAEVDSE